MSQAYGYRKRVHRGPAASRYYLAATLAVFMLLVIVAGIFFYDDLRNKKQKQPTSQIQNQQIISNLKTFRSGSFQFKDTGNWVLNTKESTENKFIYHKHKGVIVEHQLIIYVNQVPIPLYLAAARALPVRIVNGDSFDATDVSGHCISQYGEGEPHRIKHVSINGATMLCDPDTPQYSVVLAEIGGDYKLNMNRIDGSPVQFVITYKNLTLEPVPDTVKNISTTFQAL